MEKTPKCCIIVYGCAKNQVDAEEMAARLREAGYELTSDTAEADAIIVHTCGFVEDAKKESVQGILEACEAVASRTAAESGSSGKGKVAGAKPAVIVTGCLSQRYPADLIEEVPEIAGIAGTAAPRDIVQIVETILGYRLSSGAADTGDALHGNSLSFVGEPGRGAPGSSRRVLLSPGQTWAYLRLGEGCRHHCTYCAIPSMRGGLASRPMDDILTEARSLTQAGVRELNLIAQDLCDYGYDWDGRRRLPDLIKELVRIPDLSWVRLLYLRPDGITKELADSMAHYRVAPYVDLPIEHGSASVLRRMGRPGPDEIMKAVELLRSSIPQMFIRTTVITGFPGETEKDIDETKSLLSAMGAHRVGVFPFSREEGTPAYSLPNQIPPEVARERAEALRRFGLDLARVSSKSLVGNEVPVILVKPSVRPGYWVGRGPHQAPEVDGRIYVKMDKTGSAINTFVDVQIHRAGVLDLFGAVRDKPEMA